MKETLEGREGGKGEERWGEEVIKNEIEREEEIETELK